MEQAVSASIRKPVPPSITTPSNSTAAGTDFPVIVQSTPSRYSPAKSLTVVASLTVKAANVGIRAGLALHGRQRVDSVRKGTFQCCMVTLLGGRCRIAMESVAAHTTSTVIGGIASSDPQPAPRHGVNPIHRPARRNRSSSPSAEWPTSPPPARPPASCQGRR